MLQQLLNRKLQAHHAQHILASMSHPRALSVLKSGPHCSKCMLSCSYVWCMHKRWGVKSVMMGVMLILIYFR